MYQFYQSVSIRRYSIKTHKFSQIQQPLACYFYWLLFYSWRFILSNSSFIYDKYCKC